MNEWPCKTCANKDSLYVCDATYCEKVKEYKRLQTINPLYEELGELAKQIVIQTMQEAEHKHGVDGWKNISPWEHLNHAMQHLVNKSMRDKSEDHIAHAMTRCAMIKYLEGIK